MKQVKGDSNKNKQITIKLGRALFTDKFDILII